MYSIVLLMAMSGAADTPACHRGGGCSGGAGYACSGSYGCCGGGYGCHGGRRHGCHGGGGCCGGYGCAGVAYGGCCGGMMAPGMMAPGGMRAEPVPPPKPGGAAAIPTPATLTVSLPDDATLTINNQPTTSTTGQRIFVSPPLAPGQDYRYTLTAEVVRDGQKLKTTKQVIVQAGRQSQVQLEFPAVTVGGQ